MLEWLLSLLLLLRNGWFKYSETKLFVEIFVFDEKSFKFDDAGHIIFFDAVFFFYIWRVDIFVYDVRIYILLSVNLWLQIQLACVESKPSLRSSMIKKLML